MKKLQPFQLYHRIVKMIALRKNEGFHKKNFNWFGREVAVQAKRIQTEPKTIPTSERQVKKTLRKMFTE